MELTNEQLEAYLAEAKALIDEILEEVDALEAHTQETVEVSTALLIEAAELSAAIERDERIEATARLDAVSTLAAIPTDVEVGAGEVAE